MGNIYQKIISLLQQAGIDTLNVTRKDIAPVDEFHIGGYEMSRELANAADLKQGMRILDVGCGLGGPCRMFAAEYGCMATGIDITPEYVETATRFSLLTGLQQGTHFVHGSATDLPFIGNSFDMVWTQHVQMSIADKKKFYGEITRVLVPGGRFVYYDVFSANDKAIYFPVPWADDAFTSYLMSVTDLKEYLRNAGLTQINTTDQTEKSAAYLQRINSKGLPALGTHLMMGDNATQKLSNLLRNLSEKKIVVESGICKKTH